MSCAGGTVIPSSIDSARDSQTMLDLRRWIWAPPPTVRRIVSVVALTALALAFPTAAFAHGIDRRFESPLPLAVYVAGAAAAVALSFAFVIGRGMRAGPARPGAVRVVPRPVRLVIRGLGLMAWLWIVAQAILGGGGNADVASLFLWVYGWVGLPLVSAFAFPIWRWLDPFTTLYDLGKAFLTRLGVAAWQPAPYPARLGQWPAVAGFVFFVWIELAAHLGMDGRPAAVLMIGYTVLTLLFMGVYGREIWRSNGETFSVWLGTIGRLAPFGPAEGRDDVVVRRPFASGLLDLDWSAARLTLIAIGTGSIIYDGLSQTPLFFDAFGLPNLIEGTLLLSLVLGGLSLVVLCVARIAGRVAIGAGLVPIAIGYLIAHYSTSLFGDGQRIVVALSDPFVQGWDLFGTAFYQPGTDWIPPGFVWTVVLLAVVGGHILGAWSGHVAAGRNAGGYRRHRQAPLAMLMIALTVTTLWSLGQSVVSEDAERAAQTIRSCLGPAAPAPSARVTSTGAMTTGLAVVSATSVAFRSSRYGYGIVHPAEWTVIETPGSGGALPGEPGVDTFQDKSGRSLTVVNRRGAPALEAWDCVAGLGGGRGVFISASLGESLTVAGAPARLSENSLFVLPFVVHYLTVEVERRGQPLTVSLVSTTGRDRDDRAILDAILADLDW